MKNRSLGAIHSVSRNFALLIAAIALPWAAPGQWPPQSVWTRAVGNGHTSVGDMVLDAAGNVYVCGTDENGYLTAKLSSAGNVLWSSRAAGRTGLRECSAIVVDDTGNVYVTGGLPGIRSFTLTYCDFFSGCEKYRFYSPELVTIKYDNNGRRQWEASYFEGDVHFWGNDLVVDPEGAVYVVGYTIYIPAAGVISVTGTRTIKYDAAGRQLWVRANSPISPSSLGLSHGNLASVDRSGNLCLTGASGTRKLDPDGNELWNAPIHGAVLQVDDADNLYVTTVVSASPEGFPSAGRRQCRERCVRLTDYGSTLAFASVRFAPDSCCNL